ncbi:MAG: peptidoglycan DD-metalloendopeptidase family protein [Gemmatimonadetes bacterium]|nr:peptidoglycan DD-metalloendopeptidase family protein [Gemmatimonadota bacterium]
MSCHLAPARAVTLCAAASLCIACAGTPPPPEAVPEPAPPALTPVNVADAPRAELLPLRALAPRLRWTPPVPDEGRFVVLSLEPAAAGLPIFEVSAKASGRPLELIRLPGGSYLTLVAAPLGTREVPVDVEIRFFNGTRLNQRLSLKVTSRDFPASRLRVAPRYTRLDAATLARVDRERAIIAAMRETITPAPLWDGPFELPLRGPTTSPYGQRRLFNNELRSRHTGLDIDGDTGDPVHAANSGRVALSADLFFNGQAVFIDHGLGLYTGYFHLSQRDVVAGEWVEKSQVIGRVGSTGRVTGPHLHWHMYLQGFSLDPRSLLDPEFTAISQRLTPVSPLSIEP